MWSDVIVMNDKFIIFSLSNRFRGVPDKCGVERSPNSRFIGIPPLVEPEEFGSEGPVLESYPQSAQVHVGSLCPDGGSKTAPVLQFDPSCLHRGRQRVRSTSYIINQCTICCRELANIILCEVYHVYS